MCTSVMVLLISCSAKKSTTETNSDLSKDLKNFNLSSLNTNEINEKGCELESLKLKCADFKPRVQDKKIDNLENERRYHEKQLEALKQFRVEVENKINTSDLGVVEKGDLELLIIYILIVERDLNVKIFKLLDGIFEERRFLAIRGSLLKLNVSSENTKFSEKIIHKIRDRNYSVELGAFTESVFSRDAGSDAVKYIYGTKKDNNDNEYYERVLVSSDGEFDLMIKGKKGVNLNHRLLRFVNTSEDEIVQEVSWRSRFKCKVIVTKEKTDSTDLDSYNMDLEFTTSNDDSEKDFVDPYFNVILRNSGYKYNALIVSDRGKLTFKITRSSDESEIVKFLTVNSSKTIKLKFEEDKNLIDFDCKSIGTN